MYFMYMYYIVTPKPLGLYLYTHTDVLDNKHQLFPKHATPNNSLN
jgi:hypothetical protein